MLRVLAIVLLVLLLALQYTYWFGDGGFRELHWLRTQVAAQEAENALLERRNQALAAEVEDLKQGDAVVEEHAREDLGLIREGEVFYQVVSPRRGTAPDTARP